MDATNALRQTGGSDDDRPRGACGGLLLLLAVLAACAQGSAPPTSTSATPTPVCGNGVVEAREECDDGNAHNGDSCLTTCQAPASWVAGDVHAHSTGCGRYTSPDRLAALLKAQGLQVAAALVWGEGYFEDAPLFTGRDHPASGPDFILHYDMEVSHFPAARTGHLILLGLDSLRFSDDVFDSPSTGVPVVEWARRQPRAVVGMAHGQYWPADGSFPVPPGGCCVPWEVVVNAARGRLDFLTMEVVAVGDGPVDAGAIRLWTALQNTGFRVAIAGGSDWGCLTHVLGDDTPRTDVIVDGPVTYDGWLRGIKAGRTAAASGAGRRLNLRVEGRRLGEEVLLPAPQDVTVTLETQGPAAEEVEVRPRPIRVAGRERRHDEPRPRLPAQCIRPAHDREARPQGVSLVPERLALAVLPVLADRRLRGRAERRRAVEQVRSLAEPQQESMGPERESPASSRTRRSPTSRSRGFAVRPSYRATGRSASAKSLARQNASTTTSGPLRRPSPCSTSSSCPGPYPCTARLAASIPLSRASRACANVSSSDTPRPKATESPRTITRVRSPPPGGGNTVTLATLSRTFWSARGSRADLRTA
jgi:cysteine-rich repeat protein